jgi:hypothetical protein
MRINLEDLLNGLRDDEGRVESALNSEDDSLEALDADG